MASSATTAAVRVLPNNKVYRQLFDAQVQLNDAYNKVRSNQLSKPVEIRTHPDATPLVKHIRDSGVSGALNLSQRKWMKSLPYESTVENPVLLKQQQFEEKLQSDAYVELENIKKEVFNLPDTIAAPASSQGNNVTERLAASRQLKFEQLWNEFFENIAQINQDITSLDNDSFTNAYEQLDQLLPPRLESIQEYCQTIEELELERIRKIRELFKLYSDRLYNTYHLSDVETASLLEKQADELNSQVLENRRIYTELEARLLTGETDRVHRYRLQMQEYQNKWRDATWLIHKQEFNSKLKISQTKLESNLIEACRPVADEIDGKRRMLIEHINTLNKFVPPSTTRDNVQKWYQQGQTILNEIIDKKDTLLEKANDVVKYEILFLINEAQCVKKKVLEAQIYDQEQAVIIIARDIEPLIEDRKLFLEHFLTNKMQSVYNEFISHMQQVLNKLHKFIQTPAQLWDDHQLHLEHVTAQLQDMMRDARKPHDSQNEKKLTKLDSTLDEMRSASNETVLTRLLRSAYDQLDEIKASYGQFYELEHIIVNKYAGMIADEVQRYKNEIISCFKRGASSIYHTTSRTQTVYELPRLNFRIAQLDQPSSQTKSVSYENTSPSMENRTEESPYRSSLEDDNWDGVDGDRSSKQDEQQQTQTFLTEVKDQSSFMSWTQTPFIRSFQMKDNLAEIIMNTICRAFLEHNDEWKDETIKRADAVMFSKHDELDKEMDFQLHLHEPRRVRIEMDIHNVRAGN
ncbi:unnamed protein product [Didymodactylos carnosus]|uniref:DUF4455 domain-containing protein n=1 Tax=Didymodactylos carnosus TaxID=1234261 RepID=A0A8S2MXB3_9BILA|nr:unnamed protein product [Didymodactylos carnosus]CAF3966432.1 unnamed protein product [Didymodactylos carnosus]